MNLQLPLVTSIVRQNRSHFQAARQQTQQVQQATGGYRAAVAPVAADTAKTLSETDTGQGLSALQVMLGQQLAPTVQPTVQ